MIFNRLFKLLLCMTIVVACNSDYKKITEILKEMKAETISFPNDLSEYQIDEFISVTDNDTSKYKMVVYFSPLFCTSCNLDKLIEWDKIKRDINNCSYIYILSYNSKQDERDIKIILNNIMFTQKVYLDYGNNFIKLNPHIKANPIFHTFLLNDKNEIVIVGDPTSSKLIYKLYKDFLSNDVH